MILAVDVHYKENRAKAVGILFNQVDEKIIDLKVEYIDGVEEYVPGEFYKRELPCILKIIEETNLEQIDLIIIDGYIYIDNDKTFGLGALLWKTLDEKIPVIGVAKTAYFKNKETISMLHRGESKNPLFISSVGYDLNKATDLIKNMGGNYRIPGILKLLDSKTKEA